MANNGEKIKKRSLVILILMAVLSLANLFGFAIAGYSVIVGVVFFFVNKGWTDSSLDAAPIGKNLSKIKIWLWILLPTGLNFLANGLSALILPEFLDHIVSRAGQILSFDRVLLLFVQLAVSAVGEEIAWRAFFQKQASKIFSPIIAIMVTSTLFSLGHLSTGAWQVVVYDLVFVALNSIVYGIIFQKTNNVWVSALSHFLANAASIIVFVLL